MMSPAQVGAALHSGYSGLLLYCGRKWRRVVNLYLCQWYSNVSRVTARDQISLPPSIWQMETMVFTLKSAKLRRMLQKKKNFVIDSKKKFVILLHTQQLRILRYSLKGFWGLEREAATLSCSLLTIFNRNINK